MQRIFHAAAALCLLLLLIFLLLPFVVPRSSQSSYIPVNAETTPDVPLYLLRTQDNHLELIHRDGMIQEISTIDPRTLPPCDRDALADGIFIESDTALEEILQDFGS